MITLAPTAKMQDIIDALSQEGVDIHDVVNMGSEECGQLLNVACDIFERFIVADQIIVCACLVGMLVASIEGVTSQHEAEAGELVGHEQRLALHQAQILAVFRDAYKAAQHPDCPKPQGRVQ